MLYIIYFQLLLEVIFTSAAGLVMTNVTVLKLKNYCRMDPFLLPLRSKNACIEWKSPR